MSRTLLVGVGGSGCAIAQRVYQRLESVPDNGHRCAILGIDTNVGDIQQIQKNNSSFPVIQISSNRTVFDSIAKLKASGSDLSWLPEKLSYEILTRNLLKGAGQFRIFSRLALMENMLDESAFEQALNQVKNELFATDNHIATVESDGVDVLIVGSIAGGTGSGIFLPVALFLRDWLEGLQVAAMVRGMFLLPNVFIQRGLPVNQYANVRANAYASAREIHAIMQVTQGSHSASAMQFEYSPGRTLQHYDPNQPPPRKPFDYIYLLDGDAPGGRQIDGGIDDYYRMASDCAFRLLYTPLGVEIDSIVDNRIRDLNKDCVAGTTACFAALGVSGVVYPQDSMKRYLVLRYAIERLSEQWLSIDNLYQQEIQNYTIRKNSGDAHAKKPNRGQHFVTTFDRLATQGNSAPLLTQLYHNVHVQTENSEGSTTTLIGFEVFLDAFNDYVERGFWADDRVNNIPSSNGIDLSRLSAEKLESECTSSEQDLSTDFDALDGYLDEEPDRLFRTLWSIGETTAKKNLEDHHLQKWLFCSFADQNTSPHPLELRYFLYKLRQLLEEQKKSALTQKNKSRKKLLEALGREPGGIFDDSYTERIEGPHDELRNISRSNFFIKIIKGYEQDFKDNYTDHYKNTIDGLTLYGKAACTFKTSDSLIKKVDALLNIFESIFDQLNSLQRLLQQQLEEEQNKHNEDRNQGDNYLYVFADCEAKQALWDSLNIPPSIDNDPDINQVLIAEVYKFFKSQQDKTKSVFDVEQPVLDATELFQKQILDGYISKKIDTDYANQYQMTVIEAIYRQQQLQQNSGALQADENLLKNCVRQIYQQSQPFVDIDHHNQSQHFSLWGVSPENREALNNHYPGVDITLGRNDSSVVKENDFPDHEMLLLDITPGLEAIDLNRFKKRHNFPGEYLEAYQAQSSALLQEMWEKPGEATASLPFHLDYRWHHPGVLPEFSRQQDRQVQLNAIKAYLLGDALGLISQKEVAGSQGFHFDRRLLVLGDRIDELLNHIQQWPPLIDAILETFNQKTTQEQLAILSEAQLLFKLLELLQWNNIDKSMVEDGLKWWLEQLREYAIDMNPSGDENSTKEELQTKIEQITTDVRGLDQFEDPQQDLITTFTSVSEDFFNNWNQRLIDNARNQATSH